MSVSAIDALLNSTIDLLDDTINDSGATVLTVDEPTRTLNYNGSLLLGVKEDHQSERIYFLSPRYLSSDIDLTSENVRIYINYRNAINEPHIYECTDVAVTESGIIKFSWLLTNSVTVSAGNVSFNLCVKNTGTENGVEVIQNEWHTAPYSGLVLNAVEVNSQTPEIIHSPETSISQITELVNQISVVVNQNNAIIRDMDAYTKSHIDETFATKNELLEVEITKADQSDFERLDQTVTALGLNKAGKEETVELRSRTSNLEADNTTNKDDISYLKEHAISLNNRVSFLELGYATVYSDNSFECGSFTCQDANQIEYDLSSQPYDKYILVIKSSDNKLFNMVVDSNAEIFNVHNIVIHINKIGNDFIFDNVPVTITGISKTTRLLGTTNNYVTSLEDPKGDQYHYRSEIISTIIDTNSSVGALVPDDNLEYIRKVSYNSETGVLEYQCYSNFNNVDVVGTANYNVPTNLNSFGYVTLNPFIGLYSSDPIVVNVTLYAKTSANSDVEEYNNETEDID